MRAVELGGLESALRLVAVDRPSTCDHSAWEQLLEGPVPNLAVWSRFSEEATLGDGCAPHTERNRRRLACLHHVFTFLWAPSFVPGARLPKVVAIRLDSGGRLEDDAP